MKTRTFLKTVLHALSPIIFLTTYINAMEVTSPTPAGFYPPEIPTEAPGDSTYPIIHITSPEQLLPHLTPYFNMGKRVLVQFDIDHTLGDTIDQRLHDSVYAFNTALRRTIVPKTRFIDPYTSIFQDHFKLMTGTGMAPLDKNYTMTRIVAILQAHGLIAIGNTSRSVPYKTITDRHLTRNLGIDFDATCRSVGLPFFEKYFKSSPPSAFLRGVIYSAVHPKGKTLRNAIDALKQENPDFQEPLTVIAIDDKRNHLKNTFDVFGENTVLIHLDTPESPIKPESDSLKKILAHEALRLTNEQQHELAEKPIKTLTLIGISPDDAQTLVHAFLNTLNTAFLHTYKSSKENIRTIITECFGDPAKYSNKQENIMSVLQQLHRRAKRKAPLFNLISYNGTTYLASHLTQIDKQNQELLDEYGEKLYTDPIVVPADLVYECNLKSIKKFRARQTHDDLDLKQKSPRRVLSYLDLSESPPNTPNSAEPQTCSDRHSQRFEELEIRTP